MSGRAAAKKPPRFVPFGRYLLLERLAVGGMAEVYLAKRFDDGVPSDLLAIKRILPSLERDAEFIRMFLDEAKIAARLVHPGIVRIQELGRVGTAHYLAMDFVWGKDLLQIMRRVKLLGAQLSPSFVAYVGVGMCEALDHAHRMTDRHGRPMGLIHRDVSPQNVLVSFDAVVKLIDFGIAKAKSRSTETQSGTLKGKVGYMSPEQIEGAEVDHRSDLFAVGTCLYELLTLKTLFARENAFEAMENVRHVRAAPIAEARPDCPPALAAVIDRAHERDRDRRWPSAGAMGRALRAFLAEHDPTYDQVAAVTWFRDAFRKELHSERVRLDAFDQLGRAQVVDADAPRRNSVTDLEIANAPDLGPTDGDDDDESPTIIRDEPIPFVDAAPPSTDGSSEVFYSTDPRIRLSPVSAAGPAGDDADVALAASQIDSAVIQRLLPEEAAERAKAAREDTVRHRTAPDRIDPPRGGSAAGSTGWLARVLVAVALLALGAAGTWIYMAISARASVEVRTVPDVAANVLLDGVPRGTAPVRLEGIAPGHHVVTVVADGYEDATREIEIRGASSAMVEIALEPRAAP